MFVLGIDLGTSGTKTVLFDKKGNAVCSRTAEYPLSQPQNGWAEQDPLDWWSAVCETVKGVIVDSKINPSDIKSVGLSGQMHGLVMLGNDNKPLRPSIIWCDQRTAAQCDEIERLVGHERLIEITANPALTGFTASKILWVRENEPEIYESCAHILLPKDYIRFMLTGEYATDVSDASGMQLLDIPNRCWSDEVLERLGINRSLLGTVYESADITGEVTTAAAELTSLAAGTPVVGGAGDNAAAAVGVGAVTDGAAFTTIGTSGVVYVHTDKPVIDANGRVHTFCCAVKGAWHMMGVTQGAGLSLHWLRDNFCLSEVMTASQMGIDSYRVMDSEAAQIPIGSDSLIFLPYLMGERTPHLDADARGMFFGLSAIHTRAHLIRSVMEGVAFSLNDCLSVLRELGISCADMTLCGGGAKSALWKKMLADIYNIEIATNKASEGPALGAAILAMVGVGIYPSVESACKAIVARDKVMPSDEKSHLQYMKYYEIYKKLYKANRELFKLLKGNENV